MAGGNGQAPPHTTGASEPGVYTGETVICFGGREVPLRLRYREIAALRSLYGNEWPDRYREAIDGDAAILAKILAIMSGIAEDEILDMTPAGHLAVADAMLDMYFVAQHGPAWRQKREEARTAAAEASVTEGPLLQMLTRLLRASRRPQQSESPQPTSGS